jgi:hypothetical protein
MGRVERRVMAAIECCRTAALGGHVEACDDCLHRHVAYNSCRNRPRSILGPKCQGLARAEWLAEWQAELLPVPYFHVVFTVPAQVAAIAFHNKAVVYAILFHAAAETLKIIAGSSEQLQAAFDEGRLRFFGEQAGLVEARAFKGQLQALRKVSWVVYAKPLNRSTGKH